jgi:hypothetical protein
MIKARYPVTRRLYKEITGNDPGWPEGEADERPVNQVTWYAALTHNLPHRRHYARLQVNAARISTAILLFWRARVLSAKS